MSEREIPKHITGERSSIDDIIDLYKKDVDRTLLRANLKLTIEQRLLNLMELQMFAEEMRRAGKAARAREK